jgi:pimeloyl-ACP methyl ester carboxylesterase
MYLLTSASNNLKRFNKMRRLALRLVAFLMILYVLVVTWVYINQKSLMYFPLPDKEEAKSHNLGNTEEIFLTTDDNIKIQTWYHLPSKAGMPMVVYLHGNSYNLPNRKLKFKELIDLGYGYIAPAWRGFGKSEGTPSKEGLFNDARAAIQLLKTLGYNTEDTIIIGESLGSGIAVKMATEYKFKGVFLITPYTTTADRAQEMYWYLPAKLLIKDNFDNASFLDKINAPLLIVHGTKDEVIPHTHSEKLMIIAHEPKKLIIYDGKGHSNLDSREIFNEMTTFFNITRSN